MQVESKSTTFDDAPHPVIRLSIVGMRCAGCVKSVEDSIQSVSGVESVGINFVDHSASVTGDIDPATLKRTVSDAGYEAAVMGGLEDVREEELRYAGSNSKFRKILGHRCEIHLMYSELKSMGNGPMAKNHPLDLMMR